MGAVSTFVAGTESASFAVLASLLCRGFGVCSLVCLGGFCSALDASRYFDADGLHLVPHPVRIVVEAGSISGSPHTPEELDDRPWLQVVSCPVNVEIRQYCLLHNDTYRLWEEVEAIRIEIL